MSDLQVTQTMRFDPNELALALQETFEPYLLPLEYTHEQLEEHLHLAEFVRRGRLPAHVLETQPLRGLAMVEEAVAWVLNDAALYKKAHRAPTQLTPEQEAQALLSNRRPVPNASPAFVLRSHFMPQYRLPEHEETLQELTQRASDMMIDLRNAVREFVGKDGWVMFFYRRAGRDIVIDRTVDFRILDWERRMASGEWQ